jgi:hypothetical protein
VAAPPVPSAPELLSSQSTGAAGGETTTSTSPELVGTTFPGATVRLLIPSATAGSGPTTTSTTSANGSGNYQFTVSGPLSPGSYSYQVEVIDKYGDVSSPSTVQTITVLPPLVTVTGVTDKMNKKHQVTQVTVVFSGSVNSTEADIKNGIYRLATPGKHGSYTARNAVVIPLKSATYTDSMHSVVLIPKKPFALTKPVQLLINGLSPSGLEDSFGRLIDGNDDGQPGGNAIAILSKKGVTVSAVALAHVNTSQDENIRLIDAILAGGLPLGRTTRHV